MGMSRCWCSELWRPVHQRPEPDNERDSFAAVIKSHNL
ncbi:hypothetical protein yfred0001_36570 [Yersinia frederiksenii ATCC 33641]|nr:hypothetical protein yfred0001_36570 [Yersinia frederiksenii ATCC 33641]